MRATREAVRPIELAANYYKTLNRKTKKTEKRKEKVTEQAANVL